MLSRLLGLVAQVSPPAKKRLNASWYRYVSRRYRNPELTFMNYGFLDERPLDAAPSLQPEDEPYRLYIQLYHYLTEGVALQGRDVLEVGCGRGGGASYLMRYLRPASLTAVDLIAESVDFCRTRHRIPGLTFLQGDAEALPLADASFDVVVTVESVHCYPSVGRFLGEVERVLRPGGFLLMADFWHPHQMAGLARELSEAGLQGLREQVITSGVVRALDADHGRKRALIEAHVFPFFRGLFARAVALRGTEIYEAFRGGRLEYVSHIARKP